MCEGYDREERKKGICDNGSEVSFVNIMCDFFCCGMS